MNKLIYAFILVFTAGIVIFLLNLIFLPTDILNYFPSFTIDGWQKVHNSLLTDPITQFEPWRIYAKEYFLNFNIPIWNNLNAGGTPFLATPHNSIFYPPNLIYYIFKPSFSLVTIHLIKLILFLVFTFYFLKSLKFNSKLSIIGSIVAVSSYMILWLQWPQTNIFLLFPLLLLIFEKFDIKKGRSKFIFINSLIYFIGVTGGHPETLFNVFVMHSIYAYLRKGEFYTLFLIFISFVISLMLGAFLILPFIEYLFNSYAYSIRSESSHISSLPVVSIPFFSLPQLFGAPHLTFYKSLSDSSNYAEYTAGSVGLIATILIFLTAFKVKKNSILRLSLVMILISFLFAYVLGFLTNIISIPVISANAHHRFIAYAGFFASIPVILGISYLQKNKSKFPKSLKFLILTLTILFIIFLFLNSQDKIINFLIFETKYFLFLITTTIIFFTVLFIKSRRKYALLAFILFLQITIPIIYYNNITKTYNYYPRNEFIAKLLENKDKRILQVGSMNLPPDINMAYGLESAENYDAMDVKSYKEAFDNSFPIKNHLGLVDEVSHENLMKFGIGMVISDYDLNSDKVNIQKEITSRISANQIISFPIENIEGDLIGLRFITESYNRHNTCSLLIEISNEVTGELIEANNMSCSQIRDQMFYTVHINAKLNKDTKYIVKISPLKSWENNFIALKGGENNFPYTDLIIKNNRQDFKKIFSKNSVNIFLFNNSSKINSNLNYKILHQSPTDLEFLTSSDKDGFIEIKNTFYPGWKAEIDGKNAQIIGKNPFIKLLIPKGEHFIKISYDSKIIIFGFLVSLITFSMIFIFALRNILKSQKFINLLNITSKKVRAKNFKWHFYVFLICLLMSTIIFSIFLIFSPVSFPFPYNQSINWLTVNNYPIQRDTLYLISGIVFVILFSIFQYLIWLFKKS